MSIKTVARQRPASPTRPRRRSRLAVREAVSGYVFSLPWILGLALFTVGPIIASLYLSFTEYNVLSPPRWAGISNYAKAFTGDELFWGSLGRTFRYALTVVPLSLAGSLLLAIMLNQGLKGTSICRTLFFLPHLTPVVAMAILWKWLLQEEVGPANYLLVGMGLPRIPWLSSQKVALNSLCLIAIWSAVGSNPMLIFLASLQGVPKELYEAAEIDGAGRTAQIRHITIPMISPAIFFNLVLGIIGALKVFDLAYVGTQGGPGYSTYFYGLHIYSTAFKYFRMGYGCALAWFLAIILFALTYMQAKGADRWVYYEGGSA